MSKSYKSPVVLSREFQTDGAETWKAQELKASLLHTVISMCINCSFLHLYLLFSYHFSACCHVGSKNSEGPKVI